MDIENNFWLNNIAMIMSITALIFVLTIRKIHFPIVKYEYEVMKIHNFDIIYKIAHINLKHGYTKKHFSKRFLNESFVSSIFLAVSIYLGHKIPVFFNNNKELIK